MFLEKQKQILKLINERSSQNFKLTAFFLNPNSMKMTKLGFESLRKYLPEIKLYSLKLQAPTISELMSLCRFAQEPFYLKTTMFSEQSTSLETTDENLVIFYNLAKGKSKDFFAYLK